MLLNTQEIDWLLEYVGMSLQMFSSPSPSPEQAQFTKELDAIFNKLIWAKFVISRNGSQDNVINGNIVEIDLTILELEMFENLAKTGQFTELQNKIRNYINRVEVVTTPPEQRFLAISYEEGICLLGGLRLLRERNAQLISHIQELESYILNYIHVFEHGGTARVPITNLQCHSLDTGLKFLHNDQLKNQTGFFKRKSNLDRIARTMTKLQNVGFNLA